MYTPQEIVASATKLVTLPAVFIRAKSVVDDPTSTPMDLAKAISADPAMTARLLKLINSAFWGFGGGIDSLARAVSLLGMDHVHDLVLASSLAQTFERMPPGRMDVEWFWRSSVFRALAATSLARQAEVVDLGRVFTQGLLSDLGHMVLYLTVPELAAQALAQTISHPWDTAQAERTLIGCDYAQVGGALSDAWRLAPSYGDAIRYQNTPQDADSAGLEASLLHVAGLLAQGHAYDIDTATVIERINPFAWQTLRLAPNCLTQIVPEVEMELAATARMFGVSTGSAS